MARKKKILVADGRSVSEFSFDGASVSGKVSYEVLGDEDGVLSVLGPDGQAYLVHDPYAERYALADSGRRMRVFAYDFLEIVKCDTLRFVCFIIPKNGCSCIVSSALRYDYGLDFGNSFVWTYHRPVNCRLYSTAAKTMLDSGAWEGYRKFIVVQDERERFVKFMNWTHKARYNGFVDTSLHKAKSPHDAVMEHLLLYPYFGRDMRVGDQHATPQVSFVDAAVERLYGGNRQAWESDVEPVHLDNLREWFGDTFGVPMVMNNIDTEEDKLFSLDRFTDDELIELDRVVPAFDTRL